MEVRVCKAIIAGLFSWLTRPDLEESNIAIIALRGLPANSDVQGLIFDLCQSPALLPQVS